MSLIPAALAILILLCSLIVFPIACAIIFPVRNRWSRFWDPPKVIEIIIPCHNERGRLKRTIESVKASICEMNEYYPKIEVKIVCGLDDCSDETELDAKSFDLEVRYFKYRSKWMVIRDLILASTSDWIVLIDAGVIWDSRLLRNSIPLISDSNVIGLSPMYSSPSIGFLSRLYWNVEAYLKSIENASGGPISVHGATVFYHTPSLHKVMKLLSGIAWINDDVVIPLMLRTVFPEKYILYSRNKRLGFLVQDTTTRSALVDFTARERVARGNTQWIRYILPAVFRWNKIAFLIALRRVFRLYWASVVILFILSLVFLVYEWADGNYLFRISTPFLLALLLIFMLTKVRSFRPSMKALMDLIFARKFEEGKVIWK